MRIEKRSIQTKDLEEIILKYWPKIKFRIKKCIGHSNSDWEGVASEILMDAIQAFKSGKFRGDSSISTFIYTMTSRRILDYILNRHPVLQDAPETTGCSDKQEDLENEEGAAIESRSFLRLSPLHADVLYLHHYQGLSQEEVARVFGISVHSVAEVIKDAKKTLEKIKNNGKPSFPTFSKD